MHTLVFVIIGHAQWSDLGNKIRNLNGGPVRPKLSCGLSYKRSFFISSMSSDDFVQAVLKTIRNLPVEISTWLGLSHNAHYGKLDTVTVDWFAMFKDIDIHRDLQAGVYRNTFYSSEWMSEPFIFKFTVYILIRF